MSVTNVLSSKEIKRNSALIIVRSRFRSLSFRGSLLQEDDAIGWSPLRLIPPVYLYTWNQRFHLRDPVFSLPLQVRLLIRVHSGVPVKGECTFTASLITIFTPVRDSKGPSNFTFVCLKILHLDLINNGIRRARDWGSETSLLLQVHLTYK